MSDRLKPRPQYDQLSQAIIHAILSSKEVQALVAELQSQGALDGEDIVALALRFPPHGGLEAKVELMRKSAAEETEIEADEEEMAEVVEDESPSPLAGNGRGQAADRRPMSPNEVAFEKYLEDQFDDEAWMKSAGIRFLSREEEAPLHEGESPEKEAE